ncbi:MAG: hypothetical protein ABFD81_07095 [Syntrophaceae bacterium]
MNGDHEEIVSILCDEDWAHLPKEVFQRKVGQGMTYLLRKSMHRDWKMAGISALSGFLGGAFVWVALIIASGDKFFK